MNKLLLGRYINGDSLVHRMDARSKLVLSFYFVAIIFLCNNWQTYLLLAAFVLMCVKFSDLGIGFFIKGVKPLLGLIVFTVLLQVFFTRGGHVYWAFGPLSLTHFGIVNGFYVFCRFVLIIFMSTLLTLTTAPLEISDAIESLLKPLKAIKVPVYEISLMLSIALRFVPTLMDETEKIMNAQKIARRQFFGRDSDATDQGRDSAAYSVVRQFVQPCGRTCDGNGSTRLSRR